MSLSHGQYNVFQQLTSARAASAANLAGNYINGQLNNGVGATLTAASPAALTVDGVSLNVNDRVLLDQQTNANENGIYIVLSAGSASSVWQLQRSADLQSQEQLKLGQFLTINAGSTLAGSMWVLVEPLPSVLGVNALTFTKS